MSGSSMPAWIRARHSLKIYLASISVIVASLFLINTFRYKAAPLGTLPRPSAQDSSALDDPTDSGGVWRFHVARDSRNLGLSDEQCEVWSARLSFQSLCFADALLDQTAFPELYTEIEHSRAHFGRSSVHREQVKIHVDPTAWPHAQMHVLIYNGQMYIIDENIGASNRARGMAGLSNLYRAITAVHDPTTIPNVEFILDLEDRPTEGMPQERIAWSWNRPKAKRNIWVVPDFDGWAFPDANLGSYVSFRERLPFVETPFEDKDPRPVWRGTMNSEARTALMNVARGQEWADVDEMNPSTRMDMVDFCKYKFPIHTEGNAWSGRLRYLQNCHSVAIIHQPLEYQAHYYDLLVADGPDQNFISIRNDFSDLHEKMQYYHSHLEATDRIVNNSVATFRDRYLTPAAEACYWRRLLRAWAEVQAFSPTAYVNARKPDGTAWKKQRGIDWEIFSQPDPNFPFEFPKGST